MAPGYQSRASIQSHVPTNCIKLDNQLLAAITHFLFSVQFVFGKSEDDHSQ